jgi:hypothetical protein
MSDEVIFNEAWYICPTHGAVHHRTGPNVEEPCPECAGPASLVDVWDREFEGMVDKVKRRGHEAVFLPRPDDEDDAS